MNYLAHALLSGPDPGWRLGGFLGDHVRGGDWCSYPPAVAAGILLHRRIDSYTDRHPAFGASRARLTPTLRRYGGIVVDVYYDHFLAREFDRWSDVALPTFAQGCYELLRAHRQMLPRSLKRFARHLEAEDLLVNYRRRAALGPVFAGIAGRLSRPGPVASAAAELEHAGSELAADFGRLFPDLIRFAAAERRRLEREF